MVKKFKILGDVKLTKDLSLAVNNRWVIFIKCCTIKYICEYLSYGNKLVNTQISHFITFRLLFYSR